MDPEQTFLRVHTRLSGMLSQLLTPRIRMVLEYIYLAVAVALFCLLVVMHISFVQQKLTLADHWHIYEGEEDALRRRFSARKHVTLLPSKVLARVTPYCGERGPIYCVEGSFSHRSCVVYEERRRPVFEIRRKEVVGGMAFGGDVFRLIVQPGFDSGLAMAILILLEQMFGSRAAPIRGCD